MFPVDELPSVHWIESVLIQTHSGPHFPSFTLNTTVSLRIQSEYAKMQTRITTDTNSDTFYAVVMIYEHSVQVEFLYLEASIGIITKCIFKYSLLV